MKRLLFILMLVLLCSFTFAGTEFVDLTNYYKYDTDADDFIDSNNGVIDGATPTTYGIINDAYYYDKTNDVINLDDDSFETDNIGSISVWVNVTDYTNNQPIIGNSIVTATSMLRIGVLATSGKAFIQFYENPGSHNIMQTTNAVGTNALHHIVVTSDGSTWKIYIDGSAEVLSALVGSNTGQWFSDLKAGTHETLIGNLVFSTTTKEWFGGVIDELGYWNRELTPAEVTTLYNGGGGLQPTTTTLNYTEILLTSPSPDKNLTFDVQGNTTDTTPTFQITFNTGATAVNINGTTSCTTGDNLVWTCTHPELTAGLHDINFNATDGTTTINFTRTVDIIQSLNFTYGINITKMYFNPNISNYNFTTGSLTEFNDEVINQTITNPYLTICNDGVLNISLVGWINETSSAHIVKCNTEYNYLTATNLTLTNSTFNSSIPSGECNNIYCWMDWLNATEPFYFIEYWGAS